MAVATRRRKSAGGSVTGYYRALFARMPQLLTAPNESIFNQVLMDHPNWTAVPAKFRTGLANAKAGMRRASGVRPGRRGRKRKAAAAAINGATGGTTTTNLATPPARRGRPAGSGRRQATPSTTTPARSGNSLSQLEVNIDSCMFQAQTIGSARLGPAIEALRNARDIVVRATS